MSCGTFSKILQGNKESGKPSWLFILLEITAKAPSNSALHNMYLNKTSTMDNVVYPTRKKDGMAMAGMILIQSV